MKCLLLVLLASGCMKSPPISEGPAEWEAVALPIPEGVHRVSVREIAGSGPTDVWVLAYAEREDDRRHRDGLAFHFDGAAWRVVDVPPRTRNALLVLAPDDVWAAGVYGTVAHWDGRAWSETKLPDLPYDLLSLAGTKDDVWAAYSANRLLHFDGRNWAATDIPGLEEKKTVGVQRLATLPGGDVLAPHLLSEADRPGVLWRSAGRWTLHETGPGGQIRIAGSGARDVWTVGNAGRSYHFDGEVWKPVAMPLMKIVGAYATAPGDAWVVGQAGVALHWDGASWKTSPTGVTTTLWTVYAPKGMAPLAGGDAGLLRRKR